MPPPKRRHPLGLRSAHHRKYNPVPNKSDISCPKCSSFDWQSIHALHVELTSCPGGSATCEIRRNIADIDEQVTDILDTLSVLMKRRRDLLHTMNSRHGSLNRRLPVELVSKIFVFVEQAAKEEDLPWFTAVELGTVCKLWREITLSTHQLWASVTIDLRIDPDRLDFIEEWLRRSGDLPLDLTIWCSKDDYGGVADPSNNKNFGALRDVLRGETRRWYHLNLATQYANTILNDIESTPPIEILTISSGNIPQFRLHDPFRLKVLRSNGYTWMNIPINWDSLTTLEINSEVQIRKLLKTIQNAKQLTRCIIEDIYHLLVVVSDGTVISHSLEHLETDGRILRYLTLPSLRYLKCDITSNASNTSITSRQFDELAAFIDRSRAPLQTFAVHYTLSHTDDLVFDRFPTITHLVVTFLTGSSEDSDVMTRMRRFLGNLAYDRQTNGSPTVLPNLQKLDLETWSSWFPWPSILDIFPPESGHTTHSYTRPLSSVSVLIRTDNSSRHVSVVPRDVWIDKETFSRLLEVRKSGVKLDFWIHGHFSENTDVFKYLQDHAYRM